MQMMHDLHWLLNRAFMFQKNNIYTYIRLTYTTYICDIQEMYKPAKPWISDILFQESGQSDIMVDSFLMIQRHYGTIYAVLI